MAAPGWVLAVVPGVVLCGRCVALCGAIPKCDAYVAGKFVQCTPHTLRHGCQLFVLTKMMIFLNMLVRKEPTSYMALGSRLPATEGCVCCCVALNIFQCKTMSPCRGGAVHWDQLDPFMSRSVPPSHIQCLSSPLTPDFEQPMH